jgi:hypothetical protein
VESTGALQVEISLHSSEQQKNRMGGLGGSKLKELGSILSTISLVERIFIKFADKFLQ